MVERGAQIEEDLSYQQFPTRLDVGHAKHSKSVPTGLGVTVEHVSLAARANDGLDARRQVIDLTLRAVNLAVDPAGLVDHAPTLPTGCVGHLDARAMRA